MIATGEKFSRDSVQDILDLTPLQEGLLFHYLKDPNGAQYHEQLCLSIAGNLDWDCFQQAWEHVIQSNEMLRTVFRWSGLKKPVQIVLKEVAVNISSSDFSHLEVRERIPRVEEMKQADYAQAFDLSQIAFRIHLCRLAEQEFLLIISNHHILYDGWSNGIILSEFFGNYQRLQDGEQLSAPGKTPFKAYHQWLQRQDQQQQKQFWRAYLQGFHTQTTLPIVSRRATETRTSARHKVVCSSELKQRLETFCRAYQVTPAAVLYSAFGLVLQKYTSTSDVLFGTTVAGRTADLADMLKMVGLFINTLPLRVQGRQEETILEIVQRVNADVLARQRFEATSLVDMKSVSQLESWEELFSVLMVIENYPLDQRLLSGDASLAITDFSLTEMTSYDITVTISLLFDSIEVVFTSVKERVEETAIARLSHAFLNVCQELIEHPLQQLRELEIISPWEKQQILSLFNATAKTYAREKTLHGLFAEQVERYGERPAVVAAGGVLTYRQLDEKSSRLAAYLQAQGVENESIVGICAERSLDLLVGIFAIIKAGGAYLPFDPRLPVERISTILEDSGAKLVLCQERFQGLLGSHSRVLCLEDARLYAAPPIFAPTSRPEHAAYVIYTSGSTGKPKGVVVEHRSVINRLSWAQQYFALREDDIILQKTNIMFDVSVWEVFGWLFGGSTLCLLPSGAEADPGALVEAIARERVTSVHFVPSMLQLFLDHLQSHQVREQLQHLQWVLASGEALRPGQVEQFYALLPGAQLVNLYGPTEATIDVSAYRCRQEDGRRENVPIGRPIDNMRLYVLNESHTLQPVGVPGELFLAGVGVARGYLHAAELTAQRFLQDPFFPEDRMYQSGDLVRWTPDGDLEYLGRLDHQVKVRGFRVELLEIEAHLLAIPSVKEAVVLVVKDAAGDDRLVACVVPSPGSVLDRRALNQALAAKIPDFMMPDTYIELEQFPLAQTGKADRSKLRQIASANGERRRPQATPERELNAVERVVAEIWADVLGVERVGLDEEFFEVGGNSLKIIRVCSRLMSALQVDLPVTALFQYPTVRALARHLTTINESESSEPQAVIPPEPDVDRVAVGHDVAVIGMAGRFPGARNIDEFWANLSAGIEAIRVLSEEELSACGVPEHLLANPRYVRAKGVLDGVEYFDAAFFGYAAREANLMDPQLRLLHECVWEALEDAGYNPEAYAGSIGLYAGSSSNFHWLQKMVSPAASHLDEFSLMLLNEKDFLSSRLSYKMNLKGPGVTIQTACSTSLAAIHYAYQEVLQGRCDMAVAAGVSITYPVRAGYLYEEGMVFSPDGHCRAFDAQAQGTVGGNGAGVVVLKRLEDALREGDHIYAVIKGSAINNDGLGKVGFTAPGVDGQARVIAAAHAQAGVAAESITYVETHGTGTELGDPIELEALTQAFKTQEQQFCAIGSVKTNIGHLDAAAGVAGFVKTALALKHAQIPPSLHFERPNPRARLAQSPFYVNTRLVDWPRKDTPLRAGVSAFGMGGTNVHLVLEERPAEIVATRASEWQLIPLSARTADALSSVASRLSLYVQAHPELSLANVAYTLQMGRKPLAYRSFVVCSTLADVQLALDEHAWSGEEEAAFVHARAGSMKEDRSEIAFLFPGQGSQHINMGADLYRNIAGFQEEVDRCLSLLDTASGERLRAFFAADAEGFAPDLVNQTEYTQPLLFIYEYALAQLLMSWGIRPAAMIGHSLGEYVAACLSGVFSLEDALKLVVSRARLMQKQPAGSMLSVSMAEQELRKILPDQLSIAALNSKSSCVVAGPGEAIQDFAREITARGYKYRSLVTSHAFHSQMMEPVMEDFSHVVAQVTFRPPHTPFLSNSSGTWIQDHEATDPAYWVRHLRNPVRFAQGVEQLAVNGSNIWVEVGPGRVLSELARKDLARATRISLINLSRHPLEEVSDVMALYRGLGEIWLRGGSIAWEHLHRGQRRQRVSLPTYPFEAQRFWPEEPGPEQRAVSPMSLPARRDLADWFSIPSWSRTPEPTDLADEVGQASWMLFAVRSAFCEAFVHALQERDAPMVIVYPGEQFEQVSEREYIIQPHLLGDFQQLLTRMRERGHIPDIVVHLWHSTPDVFSAAMLDSLLITGFYALTNFARALSALPAQKSTRIIALTSGIEQVTGTEKLCPGKATIYGFTKICPVEYAHLTSRVVDLDLEAVTQGSVDELVKDLIAECLLQTSESSVAYRGGYRWSKEIRSARLENSPLLSRRLREGGVYLITGGLGGVGLALARFLAETGRPTLILLGRSPFPERAVWENWLEQYGQADQTSQKIRELQALEAGGARVVMYSADVANETQMGQIVREIEQHYGLVRGVIHAAGLADYAGMLQVRSYEATEAVLAPKLQGTLLLDRLLNQQELDFFVLCSSIGNVISQQKFGQSGYNAANEFLDAYAFYRRKQSKTFWVSINWSDWREVGMSLTSAAYWAEKLAVETREILADGITNAEGVEAFRRILSGTGTQVIVSPQALEERASKVAERLRTLLAAPQKAAFPTQADASSGHPVFSTDDLVGELAQIWQEHFGRDSVGPHENFFDLGADSFDLVQANAALQDRFKIAVPLVALYSHPTIASLARFMRTELLGETEVSTAVDLKELDKAKNLLKRASVKMKRNKL